MSVRKVLLSPDHSIFAYNTEREGVEYGELHFKDLNDRADWEVNCLFFFSHYLRYLPFFIFRMKFWIMSLILFGLIIKLFTIQYQMLN
jgi:hypothetical protein